MNTVFENDQVHWFIVTGAPRSGTTMLGRLLNTHPSVGCLSEIELPNLFARIEPFFAESRVRFDYARRFGSKHKAHREYLEQDEGNPDRIGSVSSLYRAVRHRSERDDDLAREGVSDEDGSLDSARHAVEVARTLIEIALGKRGLTRLGTKVPNLDPIEAAEQVAEALPNLRLIHIVRRPSDVVNSSLGRRGLARDGADEWHIETVADACDEWRINWNRAVAARKRLGERFLVVKYEDLVTGQSEIAEAIAAHLGLTGGLDVSICRPLPRDLEHYALAPDEKLFVDRTFGLIERSWAEPLNALLARFPLIAFPLPDDGVIDFTAAGDGRLFDGGGLSYPEPWGTWTDGALACLDMVVGDRPGDLLLTLDAIVWRLDDTLGFGFVLRVGKWSQAVTIGPGGPGQTFRTHALVPRVALPDRSRLHLELHILETKQGGDEPSDDRRALGLGLQRLGVTAMPTLAGD